MPFDSFGVVSYSPSTVTMAVCSFWWNIHYSASKNGVILKTGLGFVQGHWKWHHLIDRIALLAFHSNYGDMLYHLRDIASYIGLKSQNFYTPPVLIAPTWGDLIGISWKCLMLIKLEWLGYRMVKKNYNNVKPFSQLYLFLIKTQDNKAEFQHLLLP